MLETALSQVSDEVAEEPFGDAPADAPADAPTSLFFDEAGLLLNVVFWTLVWCFPVAFVRWWFGTPSDDRDGESPGPGGSST